MSRVFTTNSGQHFLNFNMHTSHRGILLKVRFWLTGSGIEPENLYAISAPRCPDAIGVWLTLRGAILPTRSPELLDILASFSFQWSPPLPTPVRMAVIPVLLLTRPGAFTTEATRSAAPACLVTLATGTSVLVSTCGRQPPWLWKVALYVTSPHPQNLSQKDFSLPWLTQPWNCPKSKRKAILWVKKQSQGYFPLD